MQLPLASVFISGGKYSSPQTVTATATKSTVNTSPVTISSDAIRRSWYAESMADTLGVLKSMRAMALRDKDISSPDTAKLAHDMAYADNTNSGGGGGALDISGTELGGDGIIRYYSGEPVTDESMAYFNQVETRYRQEHSKLYESEMAKNTPVGEIVNKLFDLQDQQSARFRAMNMWPIDADLA